MIWRKNLLSAVAAMALAAPLAMPAQAETTLRAVMHSDLKIVDPIWTTAYITRNHGYMIYDTLFAMDENGEIQPQMAEGHTVSEDGLVYTITLRDGLLFHDGAPVTAEDAAASILRWGQRDAMGVFMMNYVDEIVAVDDKTLEIRLAKPYGLVLLSLGKPSSQVPFIMPKRVAETDPSEQITDYTGSGPFVFVAEEWQPGAIAVYEKFDDYVPRDEPPSWASGGKVAKVDRVEWIWIPDKQTSVDALINGEIDFLEQPPHDLYPILEAEPEIVMERTNTLGNQYMFRLNSLWPPFDNPKIRNAALMAVSQEPFLQAVIGNPDYYETCPAMFICGTPFATDAGGEIMVEADPAGTKAVLEAEGYDGTPIVLMHSTDLQVLTNLAPVAKQQLEQAGFNVDMQSMDWQTLVSRRAKKDPPAEGGWNIFMTSWVAADLLNPIGTAGLNTSGDTGWFGWFDLPEMEELKQRFAEAPTLEEQQVIAKEIQLYAIEQGTHGYMGQWHQSAAWRDNVSGVVYGPAPYFWNVEVN